MSKKLEEDTWVNCPECKTKVKQQNLAHHMKYAHNKIMDDAEIKPLETSHNKRQENKTKRVISKTTIAIITIIFIIVVASISVYFLSNPKESNGQPNDSNGHNDKKNYFVSIKGKGNYSSIQAAIDLASVNDIIFVSNGTYFENIIIRKSIELIGEDKNTTIINGNGLGNVIYISADNVKINGFTIMNGGTTSQNTDVRDAAGIKIESSYNTISDCNISSNLNYGIYLFANPKTTNNIIKNNTFYNNRIGLITGDSKLNDISLNTFTGNTEYGMYLEDKSNDNLISDNIFTENKYGIRIKGSEKNTVVKNLMMNNKYGLYLCCGAENNIAYNNVFINNTDWNADETLATNTWDNGLVGNYWDNYTGIDLNGDGIGDTPYIIYDDNGDRFPLMKPYLFSSRRDRVHV
ncbi:MAG: right-handed parallel beta-helix repeat-containing protein, partial [Candidatus Thermoplasmatota archaeon]|nr:right-handed parallel beta-helix repeat-containing protein [Candidatus Thermoplasmatota archaeon]